jgi:hypothetical protein
MPVRSPAPIPTGRLGGRTIAVAHGDSARIIHPSVPLPSSGGQRCAMTRSHLPQKRALQETQQGERWSCPDSMALARF